ncbi:hypothetical protein ES703_22019 [subsurface metagenome]
MPEFAPGEAKVARAPITVRPSGLSCQAEVFLGPNEMTKVATSGLVPFTSTGASQNVRLPLIMPSTEGSYHAYIDVYIEGILIAAYRALEDVVIVSVPVPVTQTFYPVGGGVILAWRDFPTSYGTVHNLTSGNIVADSAYIGQLRDEYGWMICRGFVIFDTRSLPADSKIISAVLQIYGSRDESDTDFNVVVQKGSSGHPKTTLSKADFDYRYYSGDGGRLSTIGFRVGAYNDIELNGDGISWIKKAGAPDITRLALRSSRDINFIAPFGFEMVEIPLGPTTYNPPRLVVTYQG